MRPVYEFGEFRLDRSARVLVSGERVIPLTPKVLDLLIALIDRRGEVIAKDALLKAVWPDTFVEESNLTSNISILRKQLGPHPEGGEYIETIPKRGYRFVGKVTEHTALAGLPGRPAPSAILPLPRPRRRRAISAALALAVIFAAAALLWQHPYRSTAPRVRAVAILPLADLSGDPAQDYFADGMTEALIANLAQIGCFPVISIASVMQYKNSRKALKEIARELHVDSVVRASVIRSGRRVRITAELLSAQQDRQLWAGNYERDVGEIPALQDDVARAIANKLQARVTPTEGSRAARKRPVRSDAYEAFLKARHYWNQYTDEALLKSVEYFEQAIALDPDYAEAFAGLADAWNFLRYTGTMPAEEAQRKAAAAVGKALQLNDGLAEAHCAMSVLKALDWDWAGAETEALKAISLNPGYVPAHFTYSNQLRHWGRAEESIAEARRALELDPVSPWANEQLADCYLSARKYDLAIEQYRKTLDLFPNRPSSRDSLGWAYFYSGASAQGVKHIQESYGEDPDLSPELAYLYAAAGEKGKSRQILRRLVDVSQRSPVPPHHFALIYIGLGEKDQALLWLEQAYQQHSQMMAWLKVDPRFDSLRSDPAFQDLMRRVGLI